MYKQKYDGIVIEDNGGGLALFVYAKRGMGSGEIMWGHHGYEGVKGQLTEDIHNLLNGDNPERDWEGCMDNPQAAYDDYDGYEYGWEVIAKIFCNRVVTYPCKMGAAGRIEFNVSEGNARRGQMDALPIQTVLDDGTTAYTWESEAK